MFYHYGAILPAAVAKRHYAVVITVTDGTTTASLPSFNIAIAAGTADYQ